MAPYFSISPPAGCYRNGTIFQSKGRWYDTNLIRFKQDEVRPIGGWQVRSASANAFSGAARAVLTWRDNSNNRWIAVGTSSNLYIQDESGSNHTVTPSGFTAGRADATQNLGYGGGTYGSGYFGTPRANTSAFLPASVWSLASWGEHLVGCCDTDGKLYEWALNPSVAAAVISNAPTSNAGLVVTQDGFLFALGSGGDGRRVAWCDQQNDTLWTAAATNQAGDYDLPTVGTIQCGKVVPGGALIFTDIDVWQASYIGTPLVYGFSKVGSGCGPISKGAVATQDSMAAWMGPGPAFWFFNGQTVEALDCDVLAFVADMNPNQSSKVSAVLIDDEGEVWWFFPSASSTENDSYVIWAYRESARLGRNIWTFGSLARTAGTGDGVMPNPIMVDPGGLLYLHEIGLNYGGVLPHAETGPIEIGTGNYMAEVQRIIPDDLQDGNLQLTLYGRLWPDGEEFSSATVLLDSPTEILFQAREIRCHFDFLAYDKIGTMRLEIIQGDPM